MLKINKKKNIRGQSLFEIIFAVAIAALIMTAVVVLSTDSVRNSSFSRNQTLASRLAQEAHEWLRSERDSDWTTFAGRVGTTCLGALSWSGSCAVTGTPFSREVTLTLINPTTVEADIIVSWTDGQGTHEVRSVTRLTDWR